MRDSTKIKYLTIIRQYNLVTGHFGPDAPYISKGHIIDLTISSLKESSGIVTSRIVVYRALEKAGELKKEEFMVDGH